MQKSFGAISYTHSCGEKSNKPEYVFKKQNIIIYIIFQKKIRVNKIVQTTTSFNCEAFYFASNFRALNQGGAMISLQGGKDLNTEKKCNQSNKTILYK